MTLAQTNVLRHLNPEGMRMGALAKDAGVSKQAISQAIRGLTRADLIRVEPDPEDRRARRIVYTERGRAMIACSLRHIVELEQAWERDLGAEGYQTLRAALSRLAGESCERGER